MHHRYLEIEKPAFYFFTALDSTGEDELHVKPPKAPGI